MACVNTINKDELFTHVREFLKTRGIELQAGSYSRTIQKGCQVLADTINLSQQAVDRARTEVEKTLEKVRHSIHEKTSPRRSAGAKGTGPKSSEAPPIVPTEPKAERATEKAPKRKRPPAARKTSAKRPTGRRTRRPE